MRDGEPTVAVAHVVEPAEQQGRKGCQCDNGTILVVDDDQSMLRLINLLLVRHGYRVLLADNGTQALEWATKYGPDLILLDCQMPELDGFAVCSRLRADSRFDDTPVVFLTAMTEPNDKARGFAIGGTDYISKPVERLELLARIRTHLELARTRRQLRKQAFLLEGVVETQLGRLDQVRDGQECLLTDPATLIDIEAAVRFQPAQEAGGDFYEIASLGDDEVGVLVADVSGHDLAVAYLTGAMKALAVSFTSEALSVSDTIVMLNASLRKFLDPGRYATACYAKLSRSRMTLEVISAGHPAPLMQSNDNDMRYLDLVGDVLGMHEEVMCGTKLVSVQPGERVFLYTDGLIEAVADASGKKGSRRVGSQYLADSISRKAGLGLQEVVDAVVDELLDANGGTVEDDVVLAGIAF